VATIYLQLIQNRYMFRSFTVLQCSHQHCVQPVASDVEVVGYFCSACCVDSSNGAVYRLKNLWSSSEASRSHKDLSPCDFDLIPKMKEPLGGIRFRTVPEILQAADLSIRTINTTGAAKGILRLPHRWQWVVHNAGDYNEGK